MTALKTRPTQASVRAFVDAIDDPDKRRDARKVAALMRKATGKPARMWGPSIVGYGKYRYTNTAGKDFEWMLTGYSPRKQALTVYIMSGFGKYADLLEGLGKFKTGKSCLYIKRLSDVDVAVLEKLIRASVADMRRRYETD